MNIFGKMKLKENSPIDEPLRAKTEKQQVFSNRLGSQVKPPKSDRSHVVL